ncbi:hypothetical protein RB653_000975 [Dictyostelium firmibasis]|uniref:Uncharacterized protein n=1 Tax=Dictyostelium firmibasis TaxID=79012 RepID=A0AAN7U6N7_9MYCE
MCSEYGLVEFNSSESTVTLIKSIHYGTCEIDKNQTLVSSTYFLNKCTKLGNNSSVFVMVEPDDSPNKLKDFCNSLSFINNNCDNIIVKSFKNSSCFPIVNSDNNSTETNLFNRLSCRGSYIDVDVCNGGCSDIQCNFKETIDSNSTSCPDIQFQDLNNHSQKLNNKYCILINSNNRILLTPH